MKLEEKLVYLRKEKRLSQMKLAEMMNVSRQAVSRWETGVAVPSIDNLKYLGRIYDVPLEYVLHDDAPDSIMQEMGKNIVIPGKQKKRWVLILVAIFIIIAIFICAIFLKGNQKNSVPMDEIERSDIETDNTNDFELAF